MKKEVTIEYLKSINACELALDWAKENQSEFKSNELNYVLKRLVKLNKFNYANWLVIQQFTKEQCIKYAIFAAKKVLHIYEEKYPKDKRPRLAIEAAERYLKDPSKENAIAADAAARAAARAAAYAAVRAAAANAAYAAAAANAAYAAAYAAYAANAAAAYAANAAYAAAAAMKEKIIRYGLTLVK